MSKATLVIMAAGIGSRFGGGIKQLEPVGPCGEILMDYSIYDALEAGFDKVVFVIRKSLEKDFKEVIGHRIEKVTEVAYAYQELEDIPEKYKDRLEDRTKPWGTGQAILCCRDVVDSPFLVINADDYYGKQAFSEAYNYLINGDAADEREICMVGFVLKNTLSDNGSVTRGICRVDDRGMLVRIREAKNIEKCENGVAIRDEKGEEMLDPDSPVSMNMWGLRTNFFEILETGFDQFLLDLNPGDAQSEYLLPTIIGGLLDEGKLSVRVLESRDKWFGVTYKEDKPDVVSAIRELVNNGVYPEKLF